ncbi:hypothetical protein TrLO_g2350 [Triparma laevis f. longispina]|uniref:Rhodanese domain-containing protein n=1 Tax=Triparma laevis f. longispina TaxID=1714387 RepID=A0A9W7KST6_9STRA|nr:hypothetical protein TrLO_g2350 [Triparma laevis f. longispina]
MSSPSPYPEALQKLIIENDAKFPDVEHMSAADALALSKTTLPPIFVDCRTPAEQSISTIPYSIPYDIFSPSTATSSKIILYCTIGYRSSLNAQNLKKKHPNLQISNLSGSVLSWSHTSGPFVNPQGEPTKRLHVYGNDWDLAASDIHTIKFGFWSSIVEGFWEVTRIIKMKIT